MKVLIAITFYFVLIFPSFGQGKMYYLTGQSDSLFIEMVFFKKSDSIMFYIFDKNMNHISIPGIKGHVGFVFGKNASISIKLDSSKYNAAHERIQFSIPKEYWEDFETCELYIPIEERMTKFTIINSKKEEKENHHDIPSPGGHSH